MGTTNLTVDGYTYAYSIIAKLAAKASNIHREALTMLRIRMSGEAVAMYLPDGRLNFNGPSRLLGYLDKLKGMQSSLVGSARNRDRFNRDRKHAVDAIYDVYSSLQAMTMRGSFSDGGGLPNGEYSGSLADSDGVAECAMQGGGTYNIGETAGLGGASDGAMDLQGRVWGDKDTRKGVYFNPACNRKTEVSSIDPASVVYVSRPSDRLVDRLFSRIDLMVGGLRASTIGRWSAQPTDDLPNPVRDRCLALGIPYIWRGKAFPVGGHSNGFAWTTQAWGDGMDLLGGRALLHAKHISLIRTGWTRMVKDWPRPVAMYGVPAHFKPQPEYVGDPAATYPAVGTPGVNCCIEGMPGS